jgi:uncharacterized membrane protein YfcA
MVAATMPLLAIIAIVFVATLTRSTFGFGESLVAVPLLAIVIPIEIAVPLAVLISILVALIVVIQDHEQIHFESAKWLIAFAVLGIPVGLLVLLWADPFAVKIALGSLVAAYSAYALLGQRRLHLEHDSRLWLFGCGFLSGVLGGAYGLNGPPLVVYGNLRRWDPQRFRATLQAYFLPASLLGAAGYAVNGLVDATVLRDFALCLPAVIPAVLLGRWLNRRIRGTAFFKYVHVGLLVIGALLVVFTLAGVKTG